MTVSDLKYDHNIITIKSAESLRVFWNEEVAGTWMKMKTLHYLWNKLSKFSNEQKKVFHAYSFQLCSKANSKFAFNVSLYEINCFKFETLSLVSKSIYFSWNSLSFIYGDFIIRQWPKKKFKLAELFFSIARITCPVQQLVLQTLEDLILQSRDFQSRIAS